MTQAARILLIDDDPGIADNLRRVLADEGHDVSVQRRGDDGLAAVIRGDFNTVITDLRLPGMNGLELVQRLHSVRPRLPIILVTAYGTADTAITAMKSGAYDYLLKPFDPPQLLALVRKAVECNRLMSEPVLIGEVSAGRDAIIGQSARHAADLQGDRPRRIEARQRADPGRDRDGQGIDRPRPLPPQRTGEFALHRHQLRGHSRDPSRERAFRA